MKKIIIYIGVFLSMSCHFLLASQLDSLLGNKKSYGTNASSETKKSDKIPDYIKDKWRSGWGAYPCEAIVIDNQRGDITIKPFPESSRRIKVLNRQSGETHEVDCAGHVEIHLWDNQDDSSLGSLVDVDVCYPAGALKNQEIIFGLPPEVENVAMARTRYDLFDKTNHDRWFKSPDLILNYVIYASQSKFIIVKTDTGTITIEGPCASVRAQSGSGNIYVTNCADINAFSDSGAIQVECCTDARLVSKSGNITLCSELAGIVSACTGLAGTIDIKKLQGKVQARSDQGNITIKGTVDIVKAQSYGRGNIKIRGARNVGHLSTQGATSILLVADDIPDTIFCESNVYSPK